MNPTQDQLLRRQKDSTDPKLYLQSGGALRNNQIPTTTPSAISVEGLTTTETPLAIKTPSQIPIFDISKLEISPTAPLEPTVQETDIQRRIREISKSQEELAGESALRAEKEKELGVPELQKTQQDLSARLKALQTEAQVIPFQLQQEAIGRGITRAGLAPIQAEKLRANAIQALQISSMLEASRGNLSLALDLVDRAVAQKYDPIKEDIAIKKANLDLFLKDTTISIADKNRAQRQKEQQDARERAIKLQEANEKAVQTETLKYAGVADSLTLEEMGRAKNPVEVVQIAQRKGLFTLEEQKKKKEIEKVVANKENILTITEAKSYGLPISLVGKSEKEVINNLNSDISPQWFRQLLETKLSMSVTDNQLQKEWQIFRKKILEGQIKPTGPSTTPTQSKLDQLEAAL